MNSIDDAYRALGLPPQASLAEIEAAFRKIRHQYEADPGADAWEFQEVQQAYQQLRQHQALSQPQTAVETFPPSAAPSPDAKISSHLFWQAFFRQLPLQTETSLFVFVNVLDIFMTYALIRFGGIETNPIANYFLQRWGFDGMIFLKLMSVAFVSVIAQVIAARDVNKAKGLLIAGTLIVFAVVVYSGTLLMRVIR